MAESPTPTAREFRMSRSLGADQDAEYAASLTTCDSADDVRALLIAYRPLVLDALLVAAKMTAEDFRVFRIGLKQERRGKYAGDEWMHRFGAILMPQPMMTVTQIAQQYKAPFGVTYQRLKDLRPDLLQIGATNVES